LKCPKASTSNSKCSQQLNPSISLTNYKLKLKLSYDQRSVSQSVLVLGSHLKPMTRFIFVSIAGFLMWGALSHERMGL
jgi:hypothetical protein